MSSLRKLDALMGRYADAGLRITGVACSAATLRELEAEIEALTGTVIRRASDLALMVRGVAVTEADALEPDALLVRCTAAESGWHPPIELFASRRHAP